jgi:hypothetical protein
MSTEDPLTRKIRDIREHFQAKYGRPLTDEEERCLEVAETLLRKQFPHSTPDAAD